MAEKDKKFIPPYGIPWATFKNTLDKMTPDTLPNRVDRTYLPNMAGNSQTYLISALKAFGLINEKNDVQAPLKALVADPAEQKSRIAELLQTHYPDQVALGQTNATPGELDESFTKSFPSLSGDSKRKAITFFLHAAEFAGVKRSPLWAMKQRGTGGTSRRAKKPRKPKADKPAGGAKGGEAVEVVAPGRPSRTITLRSGGNVSLSYSVDLFEASEEDRKFVLDLIDRMKGYEDQRALPAGKQAQNNGSDEGGPI